MADEYDMIDCPDCGGTGGPVHVGCMKCGGTGEICNACKGAACDGDCPKCEGYEGS